MVEFNLSFFEQLILVLTGVGATAIAGILVWYVKKRIDCAEAERKEVKARLEALERRSFRIEKALLIKAKLIDAQVRKDHPQTVMELENLINSMLRDEKDQL